MRFRRRIKRSRRLKTRWKIGLGLDAGIFCETKCSKIKNLEFGAWLLGLVSWNLELSSWKIGFDAEIFSRFQTLNQ